MASALSLAAGLLFDARLGTGGIGLRSIAGTTHPYPTLIEAVGETVDAYQRICLAPTVQRLARTILRWRG